MGGKQMKFEADKLQEFEETTPFNRAEISHTFARFRELYNLFHQNAIDNFQDSGLHHIIDNHGFANPLCSLPITFIAEELPELKNNPFKYRICKAFCISDNGQINFMEFLDMISSFSPKADLEKKIFHAFQIFDIDGDGVISRSDMYAMMEMMTGINEEPLTDRVELQQWERVKKWMVDGVFFECNKRETVTTENLQESTECEDDIELLDTEQADDVHCSSKDKEALTIEDFRFCINQSPDFKNVFSFRI